MDRTRLERPKHITSYGVIENNMAGKKTPPGKTENEVGSKVTKKDVKELRGGSDIKVRLRNISRRVECWTNDGLVIEAVKTYVI